MSSASAALSLNPDISFANLAAAAGLAQQEAAGANTANLTFDVQGLNLFYGANQALFTISTWKSGATRSRPSSVLPAAAKVLLSKL
jgi:hypothetical protein